MRLNINFDSYLELEKISDGSFAPLEGFMEERDFYSVCDSMRLSNGALFPLPILLPIPKLKVKKIKLNSELLLYFRGEKVGVIIVKSVFSINFYKHIKDLFGTEDLMHPGYRMLQETGNLFVGGPIISFFSKNYRYSNFSISPKICKNKIDKLKIKTIAGFQTRNVPHRAHEYILEKALDEVEGLLIHPLIGKKKSGDFLPSAVLKSYQYLLKHKFNNKKVILGALTTSMRYSGPREAVFHALIRKNYGCTHFLVGRDHAGVGNYYKEYEAQNLCIKYEEELDIKIIKVRGPFYCKKCKKITADNICKYPQSKVEVSGTNIRKALLNNSHIQDMFMRKEIVSMLRKQKIFIR